MTGRCQLRAIAVADEQFPPQCLLQRPYAGAYRGLGDVKAISCSEKASRVDDLQKVRARSMSIMASIYCNNIALIDHLNPFAFLFVMPAFYLGSNSPTEVYSRHRIPE